MIFSDRPPGPEVSPGQILKRPKGYAAPEDSASANADKAVIKASPNESAKPSRAPAGVDPALDAKKKQADDAQTAQRKAAEEQNARIKADNCNRAKRAKLAIDSGIRIAHTNASGEREFLDDAGRAAEAKHIQGVIDSDCR